MPLIYHFRPATPNIGNKLIVMALHQLIAEAARRPFDIVNMPAKGVSAVIKAGGIIKQTVNDINQLGAGVLIGPGNLFENNGLDIDAVALDALRPAPLIFSVSWGRIFDDRGALRLRSDSMGRELIAALCRKAGAILVRDQATRQMLGALGIADAQVMGCPVLALHPDRLQLPSADPRAAGATLISLRNPALMNVSPRLQGRVHADVRRLIDGLRQMGHQQVALLCHDLRDLRFAAAYPDVPTLYTEDLRQYLAWLRDCRLNVTFRLHSLLPCAVFGTPAVHFTYDERALGLIQAAGLEDCDVHYVHAADPVAEALARCVEPAALAAAAAAARRGWPALEKVMRAGLAAWLATMEHEP